MALQYNKTALEATSCQMPTAGCHLNAMMCLFTLSLDLLVYMHYVSLQIIYIELNFLF